MQPSSESPQPKTPMSYKLKSIQEHYAERDAIQDIFNRMNLRENPNPRGILDDLGDNGSMLTLGVNITKPQETEEE